MIMCVLLCYPVSIRIYYQQGGLFLVQLASVNFDTAPTVMNSFQLIITYLKFSILFVFEYPFYIDCLFTIYAVALHLFERTCKLCKKDVEDEIHFVCVCPALELIRMKYFKILNIDKSELLIDQLSRVLTHMNVNMVINFIFDLWQERKSKLYC